MISIQQIELNVCHAYMARIREKFSSSTDVSERFLQILEIYEWHLKRKHLKRASTWPEMAAMKHGVRMAEQFIKVLPTVSRHQELAREINDVLSGIVLELAQEIVANESLYPELVWASDREREQYRQGQNVAS